MNYNVPEMTKQEVFDVVAQHLLTQMRRSTDRIDEYDTCAYHGHDGLRCAAGILIPDEKYSKEFEGYNWLLVSRKLGWNDFHFELIRALQDIHDGIKNPVNWRYALSVLALTHGLEFKF